MWPRLSLLIQTEYSKLSHGRKIEQLTTPTLLPQEKAHVTKISEITNIPSTVNQYVLWSWLTLETGSC